MYTPFCTLGGTLVGNMPPFLHPGVHTRVYASLVHLCRWYSLPYARTAVYHASYVAVLYTVRCAKCALLTPVLREKGLLYSLTGKRRKG